MTNDEIARAFSGHRFTEAYEHLAEQVVWNLIGQARLEGREAVIAACEGGPADTATTTWLRFVSTGEGDIVAVDAVGHYAEPDGVSVVSSCDIYEFGEGFIHTITSYAVELDPENPFGPDPAQ